MGKWWRRRESNPRPQVRCPWFYMLSLVINLTAPSLTGKRDERRVQLGFSALVLDKPLHDLARVDPRMPLRALDAQARLQSEASRD